MRPETPVWLLCESIGRPENTLKMKASVRECIIASSQWLMGVYMGAKIRITFARSEAELRDRRSAASEELTNELESILAAQGVSDEAVSESSNDSVSA